MATGTGTVRKARASQRDGAHCAGAGHAGGLVRRGVRGQPPAPVPARVALFHRRGADDPGEPGLAAFAARGGAQDGASARLAGRALRQGQAHRIAAAARPGSGQQRAPAAHRCGAGRGPCVPGWQVRIVDGNHLPGSQKRLAPLRGHRGAALPGHSLVVYDPDLAQVVDLVACEDAYESERTGVMPLFDSAGPGQIWIADRHFCTRTILQRCHEAGASFVVRQHSKHPVIVHEGPWGQAGRCETGLVREQALQIDQEQAPWRRIELQLDQASESGESTLWLWSNLPQSISAQQIAGLYRRRWSIEGMFGRLESVLHSEIATLGHPRAALLGFTVAVLAYNLLSLLKRCVEHAHHEEAPQLDVSTYHLAQHVRGAYVGLLIAVPSAHWSNWAPQDTNQVVPRLLALARRIIPRQVATSKHGPQDRKTQGLGRGSQGSGTCFHGPGAQGSDGSKTLKGVHLISEVNSTTVPRYYLI